MKLLTATDERRDDKEEWCVAPVTVDQKQFWQLHLARWAPLAEISVSPTDTTAGRALGGRRSISLEITHRGTGAHQQQTTGLHGMASRDGTTRVQTIFVTCAGRSVDSIDATTAPGRGI